MEQFMVVLSKIMAFVLNNYADQVAYFVGFLALSLIGWMISTVKNSYIQEALRHLYTAVQVTKQTIVDDLKDKEKDGVFDAVEQSNARENARKVFLEQFGILGKFIMSLCVGNLNKWFDHQVEVVVAEIKKS